MKLLVDRAAAAKAVFLTATPEHGDQRRYYELGSILIVCRNGLELASLAGRVVDARVGEDTAYPGFTADESRVGQRRSKVTIYRALPPNTRYKKRLSEI